MEYCGYAYCKTPCNEHWLRNSDRYVADTRSRICVNISMIYSGFHSEWIFHSSQSSRQHSGPIFCFKALFPILPNEDLSSSIIYYSRFLLVVRRMVDHQNVSNETNLQQVIVDCNWTFLIVCLEKVYFEKNSFSMGLLVTFDKCLWPKLLLMVHGLPPHFGFWNIENYQHKHSPCV